MKVIVLCQNDFPAAVYDDDAAAKRDGDRYARDLGGCWHTHTFTLITEKDMSPLRKMTNAIRDGLVNLRTTKDCDNYAELVSAAIRGCGVCSPQLEALNALMIDVGDNVALWKRKVRVVLVEID